MFHLEKLTDSTRNGIGCTQKTQRTLQQRHGSERDSSAPLHSSTEKDDCLLAQQQLGVWWEISFSIFF